MHGENNPPPYRVMTSTPPHATPPSLDILAADACEVIDLTSAPSGAFALIAQGTDDGTDIDAFLFRAPAAVRRGLTALNLHGGPKSLARQRLKGPCGAAPMERSLQALDLADRGRIVLRGASAGGFTALNVIAREPGFRRRDLLLRRERPAPAGRGHAQVRVGLPQDPGGRIRPRRSGVRRAVADHPRGADQRAGPAAARRRRQGQSARAILELARRITEAGGRCDVHLFAGEAHGFKPLDTLRAGLGLEQRFLDALT